MKTDIHPTMHSVSLTCACGNSFETLSTKENVNTEICSNCHPFFTGEQKFLDTAQRLEKFQAKVEAGSKKAEVSPVRSKKEKAAARKAKRTGETTGKEDAKAALKAAKAALSDM